jgi:hypothetical protein
MGMLVCAKQVVEELTYLRLQHNQIREIKAENRGVVDRTILVCKQISEGND